MSFAHPAPYSKYLLAPIRQVLFDQGVSDEETILDPFAGIGVLADHVPNPMFNIELEWEWAAQIPRGGVQANSISLPLRSGSIGCVVTSPTYANRLADKYDGRGRCKKCLGTGLDLDGEEASACSRCGGEGHDRSRRRTYRIFLERMPSAGSSAVMQWGAEYQILHSQVWEEVTRVCRRGAVFVLNVSNHIRKGSEMKVYEWHMAELNRLGWNTVDEVPVAKAGFRHGQNHGARVDSEFLGVLRNMT